MAGGVPTFRINGQIHHRLNTQLLPPDGRRPTYGQLYTLDGYAEVAARVGVAPGQGLNEDIVRRIATMLREHNPLTQMWRVAAARDAPNVVVSLSAELHDPHRRYNAPLVPEFGVFVPDNGDPDAPHAPRQIRLQSHTGRLITVSELHPAYDPLHYVLLFPRGESGWHPAIPHHQAPLHRRARAADQGGEEEEGEEDEGQRRGGGVGGGGRKGMTTAMEYAAYLLQVILLDSSTLPERGKMCSGCDILLT